MDWIIHYLGDWILSIGILFAAVLLGVIVHWIGLHIVARIARRTSQLLHDSILRHCSGPSRIIFPFIFLYLCLPSLEFSKSVIEVMGDLIFVLFIVSVAWLFIRLIYVLEDMVTLKYDIMLEDNLRARRIRTQFGIVKRILIVIIVIFSITAALMSFEKFRNIGTGILASAGLLGLVVGLAAQRILGNLLAGIQIALTQPIRLDDVVVVENEWGKVEEISLTYIVIRLWDLRRLVLPISYFIEKPFQNWTRATADIVGTVLFYVDYSVPVQPIREELLRILKGSGLWDGKNWGLDVTNTSEHTVELRALMGSPNSDTLWRLRCQVRENLIEFIQRTYPHALPKVRTVAEEAGTGESGPVSTVHETPEVT